MKLQKLLSLFLTLVLAFACVGATAQDDILIQNNQGVTSTVMPYVPVDAGGFFENLKNTTKALANKAKTNISDSMRDHAIGIAEQLKQPALKIGGLLVLIYLAHEMVQFMGGRTQSLTQVLFDIAVPCGLAVALISGYSTYIVQFDHLLDILAKAGADPKAGGGPIDGLFSMYGGVMSSVGDGFNSLLGKFSIRTNGLNPIAWGGVILDAFACIIFFLVIIYLIMTGSAEVLGLILLGPFLFAIGVAFGPILIVGLVTPWTREYFKSWIVFLTISKALSGVVAVILLIAADVSKSLMDGIVSTDQASAIALVITTVLLMTVNALIKQAPSITSSLFPGNIGGARGTAEGYKAGAKGSARAVKSGVQQFKASRAKVAAAKAAAKAATGGAAPVP